MNKLLVKLARFILSRTKIEVNIVANEESEFRLIPNDTITITDGSKQSEFKIFYDHCDIDTVYLRYNMNIKENDEFRLVK